MHEISELGRRRVLRYDATCGLTDNRGGNRSLGPLRHMNPEDKKCRRLLGWNDPMPADEIIDRGLGIALGLCAQTNIGFLRDPDWSGRLLGSATNAVRGVMAGVSETGHEWRYAAKRIIELVPHTRTFEQRLVLLSGFTAEICCPLHWQEICRGELYRQTGFSAGDLSPEQEAIDSERLIRDCIVAVCRTYPKDGGTSNRRYRALSRKARSMFVRHRGSPIPVWPRRVQTAREIAQDLAALPVQGELARVFLEAISSADEELVRLSERTTH